MKQETDVIMMSTVNLLSPPLRHKMFSIFYVNFCANSVVNIFLFLSTKSIQDLSVSIKKKKLKVGFVIWCISTPAFSCENISCAKTWLI